MDISILEENNNPILGRKELSVHIDFSGKPTPKKEDIQKSVAEKTKAKTEVVVIESIATSFGKGNATATALIYESAEKMKPWLPKQKEEKKPAEEGKTDTPKEGTAKEEKTDTPKEESKEAKEESPKEEKAEAPKKEKAET